MPKFDLENCCLPQTSGKTKHFLVFETLANAKLMIHSNVFFSSLRFLSLKHWKFYYTNIRLLNTLQQLYDGGINYGDISWWTRHQGPFVCSPLLHYTTWCRITEKMFGFNDNSTIFFSRINIFHCTSTYDPLTKSENLPPYIFCEHNEFVILRNWQAVYLGIIMIKTTGCCKFHNKWRS